MVFLDASAIIYLLEGDQALQRSTRQILQPLRTDDPSRPLAVSALSLLECRVQPLRQADATRLDLYDRFFGDPGLSTIDIDRTAIELATVLRAEHGLRTPDAIQAACALGTAPDAQFVTGDADFRKIPNLQVHLIQTP